MQGWIEGLQSSIDFIEQHLTDELDIEEIAGKAALSPFYYQRIFGALWDMIHRTALPKPFCAFMAYLRPEPENPRAHAIICSAAYQNIIGGRQYDGLPYC